MRVFRDCTYLEFTQAIGEDYDPEFEKAYGICSSKDMEVEDEGKTRRTDVVVVWFNGEPSLATVVHELYHAMKAVLEKAGVDDEEAEAYYLDYLIREHIE